MIAVVKDNGLGIGQQVIEIYQEIPNPPGTLGEKGYGYGLALVKHLVDTNQGELKIKSELGLYTQFLVRLPVGK